MPTESDITKKIIAALKKEVGGLWWKIHGGPHQAKGLPDIVGCYQGLFYGIEVKKPEKRRNVTELQAFTLSQIRVRGQGLSTVVTSPKEAVEFVTKTSTLKGPWRLTVEADRVSKEAIAILSSQPGSWITTKPTKICIQYPSIVAALEIQDRLEKADVDGEVELVYAGA